MSSPVVLIATAKVRPGSEDAFTAWKSRHDAAVAAFPGFNSSDIMPPSDHDNTWTFLTNFDSRENLAGWQTSKARADLLGQLAPLTTGGNLGEVMETEDPEKPHAGTVVTQVIFSRVKPGMEEKYREWATRMQQAQSRYPGYKGMYLQPPAAGGTHWITMLRFDSSEHLNAWIAAPERAAMLKEARAFIEGEELLRLATSFPGWVPIQPEQGKAPPDWKPPLLVLLGLYPIVLLEMVYLTPLIKGFSLSVQMFIGNFLSVAATSFGTIPFFIFAFRRWLFADMKTDKSASVIGLTLIILIFAAEILFFSWFMPFMGIK